MIGLGWLMRAGSADGGRMAAVTCNDLLEKQLADHAND